MTKFLLRKSWVFPCVFIITSGVIAKGELQPVDYVNPYIGNISVLLYPTHPTVSLPNSLLRVYPQRDDYTGTLLRGLPVVLTRYRGSFAFNISPFQGDENEIEPVMSYSYDQEKITPYMYSVYLDKEQIQIRFAPSRQAALYEMKFEREKPVYLTLSTEDGELRWDGEAVSGYQTLANNIKAYIWLEPETKPANAGVLKDGKMDLSQTASSGKDAAIVLKFGDKTPSLHIRYGISYIDENQARRNMESEIKSYDLKPLLEEGRRMWNEALGKMLVEGGSENEKTGFYTALYRTYERPVCISEAGRYFSGFDGKIHSDNGTPFYTDDLIWDTFRAAHPLRVLTEPKLEMNILNSYIRMAGESAHDWMPTFPSVTGDAPMMNCNHVVVSVLDAYQKGLRGFALEQAYKACKAAMTEKTLLPWSTMPAGELDRFYHEHGYLPALREGERETDPNVNSFERRQTVPVTLGNSYDSWCLAQIARVLGKTNDYNYFLKCSYDYTNLFNPETHFFHPKDDQGQFIEPFSYVTSGGLGARDYYDENNGWTYRWGLQYNLADFVDLMGGRKAFITGLDATFAEPLGREKWKFYQQFPDQTGNVGQFSMGNEPSFHIPYLYNYAGEPWKTQKSIRSLLQMWFRNDLMGIPGDEDGGAMSAYVAFSMMGFYPVTPGLSIYDIGSPVFSKVVIKMDNGREFKIIAHNCSAENKYIQSAKLNGKEWNKPWFSQHDIRNGALLELEMGKRANKSWGSAPESAPPSEGVTR